MLPRVGHPCHPLAGSGAGTRPRCRPPLSAHVCQSAISSWPPQGCHGILNAILELPLCAVISNLAGQAQSGDTPLTHHIENHEQAGAGVRL